MVAEAMFAFVYSFQSLGDQDIRCINKTQVRDNDPAWPAVVLVTPAAGYVQYNFLYKSSVRSRKAFECFMILQWMKCDAGEIKFDRGGAKP
jgi:hypothetical protein